MRKRLFMKSLMMLLPSCLLLAGGRMPVLASDSTGYNTMEYDTFDAFTEKCDSVFAIETVYIDGQGQSHVVKTGNGFLTGNSGEEASYILTGRENIYVTEEIRAQAAQEYDAVPEEMEFAVRLTVKNDVTVNAEMITSSEEMGFAVLKLEQPVHGRAPLEFAASPQDTKAMDPVYSLGSGRSVTEGQLYKWLEEEEITGFWHNAVAAGQECGGPLLNEQGNVIGINTKLLETGYMQAVSMEEVWEVLDVFGVPYTIAEPLRIEDVQNVYEEEEPEEPESVLEEAAEEYHEEVRVSAETELYLNEQAKTAPVVLLVGIGILFLVFVGIIILACRISAGDRKGRKKEKKPKEQPVFRPKEEEAPPSFEGQTGFGGETTVLGMGMPTDTDATTVLSGRLGPEECKGYLVREKNGERIYLTRSLFVIGSDGLRVDYCLKENKSVSRVHAQIRQANGEFLLEDLHATNGTFLNGVRLRNAEVCSIQAGDSVGFANEKFTFYV